MRILVRFIVSWLAFKAFSSLLDDEFAYLALHFAAGRISDGSDESCRSRSHYKSLHEVLR